MAKKKLYFDPKPNVMSLLRKLVRVPKAELEAELKAEKRRARRRKKK